MIRRPPISTLTDTPFPSRRSSDLLTIETGQYLVLSTAHIRCATGQILTAWADYPPHKQPLPVAPTQYGWFLHTMTPPPEAQRRLPKELPPILAFGRDNGCDYVLLDSDGPTEDLRSETRRVGKGGVRTGRFGGSTDT